RTATSFRWLLCRAGFWRQSVAQQHRALGSQEHRFVAALDRSESENVPRLVQGVDAVPDIAGEGCGLILWIRRPHVRPEEFEVAMAHAVLDDAVDEPFYPAHQRGQALIESRFVRGLC